MNKRVACVGPKPNCQRILQLWNDNTSVCLQTHLKRGSLYFRHSANDLFSKRIFNMKQASVHYGLTFTSDDVITGILFSGYFAFLLLLVRFFFTEFWIFENRIADVSFVADIITSDIVHPMNSGKF